MSRGPAPGGDRAFYEQKADLYREAENEVVLRHVLACLPPEGRVLDLGCGSGALLGRLAGRAGYRVGVELSPAAARAAAEVADEVLNRPVTDDLPLTPGSFDVVVCADILEHVFEPAAVLSTAAHLCRPGGAVVVSVPNVAFWQARLRLLLGVWRYEPSGLFDSGHVRFLTRETLLAMVAECGLSAGRVEPGRLPDLAPHVLARLPRSLRGAAGRAWAGVGNRLARMRPTLCAYQLVCTSRRPLTDAGVTGGP